MKTFVQEMFQEESPALYCSFRYDGTASDALGRKRTVRKLEGNDRFDRLEVIDAFAGTGFRIVTEVTVFRRFPVVECRPYLENAGDAPTGVIEEFRSLDWTRPLPEQALVVIPPAHRILTGTKLEVRYNLGSYADVNDFVAQKRELWTRPGSNAFSMESSEGRSSSAFLPFFGVDSDALHGVNIGIGWSGAWRAGVEILTGDDGFCQARNYRITLSMRKTRFRIQPGERLRQVGFFLQFREGKTVREGQNELRRFMVAHHAPYDSRGKLLPPPVSMVTWGGLSTEKMRERIAAVKEHRLPYDVFWIDAGWSGFPGECPHFLEKEIGTKSDWPVRVGNWDINTVPHPRGLKPVSDAAHNAGMRFLAWFEPERVHRQCRGKILAEHPEWLVDIGQPSLLYNLGNPEALEALFQLLSALIRNEGIDVYREDFNFNTLPYWEKMDAPDRVGVAEMKHVEGHCRLWEMLRREFPDMPIDICASGGRRLDYLTLSHGWPLCQSDYACFLDYNPECVQVENFYLNDWIPFHTGFTWMPDPCPYDFLSCGGTGVSNKIWQYDSRVIPPGYDWDYHRFWLEQNRRMRELAASGDYYPLTENPEDLTRWCAYQMHDPERDAGYLLVFRRENSRDNRMTFPLRGLDPKADYRFAPAKGEPQTVSGAELTAGREIELPEPRSALLVFYERYRNR